jgi:hypothetical protein
VFHQVEENSINYTPFRATLAHRLYKTLVWPAEQVLPLPKRLFIVPDLVLMNLPFEMLLVAAPDRPEYKPTDSPAYANYFLLHRHAIVYHPTVSLFQERSKSILKNPNLLVLAPLFGNSSGSEHLRSRTGWRFDSLPSFRKRQTV